MTRSGAWPPSRPDNDLGPVSIPEDAGLPARIAGHIQPESSDDGGYSPFSIQNSRMISPPETSADLIKRQPAVFSGQPTGDVAGTSDIELALNRAQLSFRDASDGSNNAGHVGDAHHFGMDLRQRDNRLVLNNDRSVPNRLAKLGFTGRQDRWRERLADRRAARKQARLHLKRMPTHLSDGPVLADRKRSAGSHSSLTTDQVEHGSTVLDVRGKLVGTELDQPLVPTIKPQHDLGESVVPDRVDGEGLVDLTVHRLDGGA